jgi:hypothetical protein
VTLASSPDANSRIALQLKHNEKRSLIELLMELLEEFMFASPGQLSQLAYQASISNAPNASALAKLAAAAYTTSLPLVSQLLTPVLSHDRATAASGFFLADSATVGSRSRLVKRRPPRPGARRPRFPTPGLSWLTRRATNSACWRPARPTQAAWCDSRAGIVAPADISRALERISGNRGPLGSAGRPGH